MSMNLSQAAIDRVFPAAAQVRRMYGITEQNLESAMDRPSDTPWTADENARFAAGRAETVALAMARAKSKVNGTFRLTSSGAASSGWRATFYVQGDEVEIVEVNRSNPASVADPEIRTVTRAEARDIWAEMIDVGYWRE